ncbi:histidine phosphatase family protein [Hymenobacter jeollabukensis]|uniref:Histidine phosphatase family protein n=1 Tax=Hymenobacter jeollabukensis TaxID=2025313 RepID=A0A5R8WUV2_9BACT|nr:phosphoglycerate mutase family protein [Hymenobacter jeollabukensis]TLM95539.1 histidine phosphatase family protein [Hymenobacter jeollabukensis]
MSTRLFLWVLFLTGCLGLPNCSSKSEEPAPPAVQPVVTTVHLLRHAERDNASHPTDPTLSVAGQARAQELSRLLATPVPAALFTTDFRRTRATLAPLAAATNLVPQVYDATQPAVLAALIRTQYGGKTVVVVGHSNTVLPQIEALGAPRPLADIPDTEYDNLFKITLVDGAAPVVVVSKYGQ